MQVSDGNQVWASVAELLRTQLNEAVWMSTFYDVRPIKGDARELTVSVPSNQVRDRILDLLLPYPGVRRLVTLQPEKLQPQPKRYGLIAEVDASGTLLRTLHDPTGRLAMITGIREHGGRLYLGSLTEPSIAVLDL